MKKFAFLNGIRINHWNVVHWNYIMVAGARTTAEKWCSSFVNLCRCKRSRSFGNDGTGMLTAGRVVPFLVDQRPKQKNSLFLPFFLSSSLPQRKLISLFNGNNNDNHKQAVCGDGYSFLSSFYHRPADR